MIAKEKLVRVSGLASLVLLLAAGCATQKYGEFEPKGELGQPNATAYASYGAAMAHVDGYQMAYEWQRANPKLVEDATKPEVLKKFVETPAAADALLAKIGTSYDGDPVALTQIAAVTQLVMCPKCPKAPACRKVWVAALERARAATDDGYVKTFCDQQLRLCK
ncbi:MAG: hypothetical protein IJG18_07285 [Kiritimatiellae bacterium]|nr:hypothetical protein [Kiritimatiellia bacterium]